MKKFNKDRLGRVHLGATRRNYIDKCETGALFWGSARFWGDCDKRKKCQALAISLFTALLKAKPQITHPLLGAKIRCGV